MSKKEKPIQEIDVESLAASQVFVLSPVWGCVCFSS